MLTKSKEVCVVILSLFMLGLALFFGRNVFAEDPHDHDHSHGLIEVGGDPTDSLDSLAKEELESKIQAKAKALKEIQEQMTATKQSLEQTQGERKSLQKELTLIDSNIKNLNYIIQSDSITVDQLLLEIDSLGYDITDLDGSINAKQVAVARIVQKMQKDDNSNMLAALLTSGIGEVFAVRHNLINLHEQLAMDIVSLNDLKTDRKNKLSETENKKTDINQRKTRAENTKIIVQNQKDERANLLKETKNKETVYTQIVSELEKKQGNIATEMEALEKALRAKINSNSLPGARKGLLANPVSVVRITQEHGATEFAKNGYKGKWHNGLDFGGAIGTPILAASEGTVVATGNQDSYCPRGAYGKFVVIGHPNGLTTMYAHLTRYVVNPGETVIRGQEIGYMGKTGYSTGPHLHFTVYSSPTFSMGGSVYCGPMPRGGDLDPAQYLLL